VTYAVLVLDRLGLPDSALCAAAEELARRHEHPAIVNHSIRTFLLAELAAPSLGLRDGTEYDRDELFVACVLHDVGTADAYDGPQRFEVEGADAASRFLASRGVAADARQRVWEAIALHTSPGIAERLGPVTRLTRAGVLSDFATPGLAPRRDIEALLPRLDVERHLADAVVRQALHNAAKAPRATWPGALLHAHLADPHHDGANPGF
jgi:hypothetical protein